jgi:hypothetical protein
MSNALAPLAFWLLPLSIGWGATAMANGNSAEAVPEDPIACEIRVDQSGESIVLEGFVSGRGNLSGSYQMQVRQKGLGSSRISQSGDFKVLAGAPGSLGIVSLAKSAGDYFATLTVTWDDGTADCVAQAPKSRKVELLEKNKVLPSASESLSAPSQPHRGARDPAASN